MKKIDEKKSFEEIFREYSDLVFTKALKWLKDENLAKDVLVETFERFWRFYPKIIGNRKIPGWLVKTAYHIAVDYLRERERCGDLNNENLPDNSLNPEEVCVARSEYDKIMEIAQKYLNENLYEIYQLYFCQHYSIKEIAQKKNTTEGMIKKSIYKIRKVIRERLPREMKEKYFYKEVKDGGSISDKR